MKKDREKDRPLIRDTAVETETISIAQAQDLLRKIESEKLQQLAAKLNPVKESVMKSLATVERLTEDMEHEKIKLEDVEMRFKSTVENSKRTVVTSLKREASSDFPDFQSVNDAKKFKERLETMMNRFGEVLGSHSKVLNVFMKKPAGKLKDEFETLSSLLKETRATMSEFDQDRAPAIKCSNLLNTIIQKISSIKSNELAAETTGKEIARLEVELAELKSQLSVLENSPEFKSASVKVQEIEDAEKEQEQLHAQMLDLFSHVSRALTKYSYGVTKETEARLQVLAKEPWKIFEAEDVSGYSLLLQEIRKAIDSSMIHLKDSDKALHYIDNILSSIPDLQRKAYDLKVKLDSLLKGNDKSLVRRADELREKSRYYEEELQRNKHSLEQLKRQIEEKNGDLRNLLKETEQVLFQVGQRRYSLITESTGL